MFHKFGATFRAWILCLFWDGCWPRFSIVVDTFPVHTLIGRKPYISWLLKCYCVLWPFRETYKFMISSPISISMSATSLMSCWIDIGFTLEPFRYASIDVWTFVAYMFYGFDDKCSPLGIIFGVCFRLIRFGTCWAPCQSLCALERFGKTVWGKTTLSTRSRKHQTTTGVTPTKRALPLDAGISHLGWNKYLSLFLLFVNADSSSKKNVVLPWLALEIASCV